MPRHLIPSERSRGAWTQQRRVNSQQVESSRVGDIACPPPCSVRFRTPKRQHCRDSKDSLGTVLSETVATVSLSAPPLVPCSEQLAHSRTAGTIWIWKPWHPPVSVPSLDTDQYSPPSLAPRWHVKKNTATNQVANSCHRNNTINFQLQILGAHVPTPFPNQN